MRKSVTVLLFASVLAFAQHVAAQTCANMTYPVNRATNQPPVPPTSWRSPQVSVVWVDVTVDTRGHVKDPAIAVSGGKDADEAVLNAVRNWSFQPAVCGIQPVETRIHIKMKLGVRQPGAASTQ